MNLCFLSFDVIFSAASIIESGSFFPAMAGNGSDSDLLGDLVLGFEAFFAFCFEDLTLAAAIALTRSALPLAVLTMVDQCTTVLWTSTRKKLVQVVRVMLERLQLTS